MFYSFDKQENIIGVGIDLCDIRRFQKMSAEQLDRFAKKILTPNEYVRYTTHNNHAQFLAKSFSSKEAIVKAIGTGFKGIGFRDIEISANEKNRPIVSLSTKGATIAENLHITQIQLSISHEKDYVICFAVSS